MVAVIAILSALLLPALGKARERAKAMLCANQEKQLGLGFGMYAVDLRRLAAHEQERGRQLGEEAETLRPEQDRPL